MFRCACPVLHAPTEVGCCWADIILISNISISNAPHSSLLLSLLSYCFPSAVWPLELSLLLCSATALRAMHLLCAEISRSMSAPSFLLLHAVHELHCHAGRARTLTGRDDEDHSKEDKVRVSVLFCNKYYPEVLLTVVIKY